ncbi:hypothetical protein vBSdyM006_212 [Shigella phage vB_SdyM_006]|nr:hypothetical protein vBSdyM006_212 [Shigella phage vB_SdyM_006]
MIKVKILCDGRFTSLEGIQFPIEVYATPDCDNSACINVAQSQFIKLKGFDKSASTDSYYFTPREFSVIEE